MAQKRISIMELLEKFDEVLGENSEVIGSIEGAVAVDDVISRAGLQMVWTRNGVN